LGGDALCASLADAICTFANTLQRVLHPLAVLIQQVDEDVRSLPVRKGLGKVDFFRNAGDDAADELIERPVEPSVFAARGGKQLQVPPVGFEPLFRRLL